jgi:hypothetical protein
MIAEPMILQNTSRRRGTRDAPDIAPPALPAPGSELSELARENFRQTFRVQQRIIAKRFVLVAIILKTQSHSVLKQSKKQDGISFLKISSVCAESVRRAAWLALTALKSTTSNFPVIGEQCLREASYQVAMRGALRDNL